MGRLVDDEFEIDSALFLEKFDLFTLAMDSSGQAVGFLLRKFVNQRIAQTSFRDSAFLKIIGSAIRFGTPLLIHDVETVDRVLNPVLNKELQRTGGRTLIRLGSEDIDFSPHYSIILSTRAHWPISHRTCACK